MRSKSLVEDSATNRQQRLDLTQKLQSKAKANNDEMAQALLAIQ